MLIYSQTQNVYEAAKERIHHAFDTGRPVLVNFSGGKDSTVLLEITLEVAKERGIPKVPVMFLDQEAEYTQTVEYMRYVMYRPEVEPYWLQCPFRLWNASTGDWFRPWEPGKEWIYEKDEISYKENVYGEDRFKTLLSAASKYHFGRDVIQLTGLRIEESPARRISILYGENQLERLNTGNFPEGCLAKPLFDWSYRDIWYYIFDNKVKYNKMYNQLIAKRSLSKCRVSSVIHANSFGTITELQEIDPELYNKLYRRVKNVGTTNHLLPEIWRRDYTYPHCFKDWSDYCSYLIDNIVQDKDKETYRKYLDYIHRRTKNWTKKDQDKVLSSFFWSIISEDFECSQPANMIVACGRSYLKDDVDVKNIEKENVSEL